MGQVINLTDRFALCPECGKINTLVEVVLFNDLNAVVHAGPCKSCLVRSGYLIPEEQLAEVISLDQYRVARHSSRSD